jgi:class 3 adenylate cyclase
MMQEVERFAWGTENTPLRIKIGIHTGAAIAGVIGYHKPQFSLIGDTVNTTSRICANCTEGRVLISQELFTKIIGCSDGINF